MVVAGGAKTNHNCRNKFMCAHACATKIRALGADRQSERSLRADASLVQNMTRRLLVNEVEPRDIAICSSLSSREILLHYRKYHQHEAPTSYCGESRN
eukprot:5961279-Pyramimonas_sp.AAC.1